MTLMATFRMTSQWQDCRAGRALLLVHQALSSRRLRGSDGAIAERSELIPVGRYRDWLRAIRSH